MTTTTTITQALREVKTITKRIETKTQFVAENLMRPEALKDQLAKQGGSDKVIESERQAINDLWVQQVRIRRAVEDANIATHVTVEGETRSIAEWLIWRREVAPKQQAFLRSLSTLISRQRQQAQAKGVNVVSAGQDAKPVDIVVNLDEKSLMDSMEHLEVVLGNLDGLLSLNNATVKIEY